MAYVEKKKDEDVESLIRRFKKQVIAEGILDEYRKREYYVAPALKRKLKSIEAQKRDRKLNKNKKKYIDSRLDY